MNNFNYVGPFKDHIENYLKLKKAIGYKSHADASRLRNFDQFTSVKYHQANTLTKEIVLDFCRKKTYETQANQNARASAIRQFAKYLDSIGINAYILPKGYYPKGKQYIPYIYTFDELTKFFYETDQCHYCYECPYRHLIMPVIVRHAKLLG